MERNKKVQENIDSISSVSISYEDSFFINMAALAYHRHETEIELMGASEDFKLGYIAGCSNTLKDELKWEELDMTNSEMLELLKSMDTKIDKLEDKLDKLGDKVSDLVADARVIKKERETIWKSKQLWIPIVCSIIVAVLGAAFRGEINF